MDWVEHRCELTTRIANKIYWNIADSEEMRAVCGVGDLDKIVYINNSKTWVLRVWFSFGRNGRRLNRGWSRGRGELCCGRCRIRRMRDHDIYVLQLQLLQLLLWLLRKGRRARRDKGLHWRGHLVI
jgi:hypothetical protein